MKKEVIILISILFSLTFLLNLISAANCGGDIACNCGDNLNASRTLNASDNLSCESGNGLIFTANSTILDCNGFSIHTNNYGSSNGIMTQEEPNLNNLTIQNCTISNFGNGIIINHASNVTLINISSYNNTYQGIYLYYASERIYLSKINVYDNSEEGIYYIEDWDDLTVNLTITSSSAFNNTRNGIYINQLGNGEIVDNFKVFINNVSSYSNGQSGIVLGNAITEITDSRIYNNTYNGINAGTDDDSNVYNKLRVTNSNISNNGQDGIFVRQQETDASYNLTNNYICGNLGAGGQIDSSCPFIYGYNGKDYQFINDAFPLGKLWFLEEVPWILKILVKIGILNEVPGIRDTTYTKIPFYLEAINNQYELRIREQYDERSYFDSIELMVIDHDPSIEVYPDRYSKNIITTSKNLILPISCIDNYGNNCLNLIFSLDENVKKLKKDDYIIVDFGDLSSAEKIKLVLAKGVVGAQNVKKFEVLDKKGNWVEANYKLGNIVNLNGFAITPSVFDMTGLFLTNDYKIKIHAEDLPFLNREFDERLVVNFMAIDTSKQEESIKINTLKLTSAQLISSSIEGFWSEIKVFEGDSYSLPKYSSAKKLIQYEDVTDKLQGDECNFVNVKNCDKQVIMEFGDEFSAKYNAPILENGKERDFIVITNGAYEKLPSSGHTDIFVGMDYSLSGENNTCDTTWNYNDTGSSGCANVCGLSYFAGGTGTASSPYQIETCQQLQYTTYNLTASYILNNNINCSNTTNWNYDNAYENVYRGFVPIGSGHSDAETNSISFTGIFDGNNYNITNLYVNSYYTSMNNYHYIGLFGIIGSGAVVKNLGLVDVNISGGYQYDTLGGTGGLAGYSTGDSTINNTFTTGSVNGNYYVGGLVGSHAYDPGTCFAAGTKILLANGDYKNIEYVEVGDTVKSYNELTKEKLNARVIKTFKHIADFYLIINNNLKVTPNHPMFVNGGWKEAREINIGDYLLNEEDKLIRIYSVINIDNPIEVYNFEVDSQVESEEYCGPGHSYFAEGFLAHNKCPRVYTNNGTDYLFDSLLSVYHIGKHNDGPFNYTLKYFNSPIIRIDYDPNEINYLDYVKIIVKDTALNNEGYIVQDLLPYSCTPEDNCDLDLLKEVDKNYLILDESNKEVYLNFGSLPVLREGYEREYTIYSSGYSMITTPFNIGDFPDYIQEWLTEYNKYLLGGRHHTIIGSYSSCNITGNGMSQYLGGFVGRNDGTINTSYSIGSVNGATTYIGGFVGMNYGDITSCYATGNATGVMYTGGFVGVSYGEISSCYSTGSVTSTGEDFIGGFFGGNDGNISSSYATGNITNSQDSTSAGGFGGHQTEVGRINNSFATGFLNLTGSGTIIGGLLGNNSGGAIENSYWYDRGQGLNCYSGGNENCTAKTILSYFYTITNHPMNSWNFTSIWDDVNNGVDYPVLRWQEIYLSSSTNENNEEDSTQATSSSYSPKTYYSNENLPSIGNNFNLGYNDKIKFVVDFMNHTLTMQNFNSTTARVLIQSNPINAYLEKGILKEFDLDNNSVNDLMVRYDGLNGTNAKVFIQEIVKDRSKDNVADVSEDFEEKEICEICSWKGIVLIALVFVAIVLFLRRNQIKQYPWISWIQRSKVRR